MSNKFQSPTKRGFTLVELLVVISILVLLASLLLVNFNNARVRARDARRKADLDQVKKAVTLFYNDFQSFPQSSGGQLRGCGNSTNKNPATLSLCSWGGDFSADGTQYMGYLPLNPGGTDYEYTYVNGDSFRFVVDLENASDEDIQASQTRCGYGTSNEYVVCED